MTPDQAVAWLFMVFTSLIFVLRSENRMVVRFFTGILTGAYLILFVTVFALIIR